MPRPQFFDTAVKPERAVLIGLINAQQNELQSNEYLKELEFLVETAGGETVKHFTQRLQSPDPISFVGKGKLEEIHIFIKAEGIDLAVFDDELSPSQLRNIEKTLEVKVLDRSNLILDIFAARARTTQAKTQVELAQLQYLLPRLTRMWTHLERQKGGIGMRGPGETQIETDRRIILNKIALLKEKLKQIEKQNTTQRKNRTALVRVALVGYTNVGKSTIMNKIAKSDVFAENKLFATLDTTVRKVVIEDTPFLLSDTVGFIRKLPHNLIESFKSTLNEALEADLLVHVVDLSHPRFEEQMNTVNETLRDLGIVDKDTILVFNKADAYESGLHWEQTLENLKNSWMSKEHAPVIFISALTGDNIEGLRSLLHEHIKAIHIKH